MQIAMHTAEGALRVLVLDKAADGHEHTALDTAWHHDLVITTFQRLSVEWGKGRKNVRSLFSQVRRQRLLLSATSPQARLVNSCLDDRLPTGHVGALAASDPGRGPHARGKPADDQQAVHGHQPQGRAQVDHDRCVPLLTRTCTDQQSAPLHWPELSALGTTMAENSHIPSV